MKKLPDLKTILRRREVSTSSGVKNLFKAGIKVDCINRGLGASYYTAYGLTEKAERLIELNPDLAKKAEELIEEISKLRSNQ